uniref:Uncharacterized protein n=1 Tax=Timema tahoe TaxID=61484 RepID=A0A7R9IN05_9NEOP|nr:unnamed protein product [Timema tahoe]
MLSRSLAMVLLVLALAGITKAGMHFLRLVILAAAGLAGMWMVHTLAQDYNKITSQRPGRLFKRSMEDVLHSMDWERLPPSNRLGSQPPTFPDFQRILNMDPKGCARRLVCELATRPTEKLAADEANILLMIR